MQQYSNILFDLDGTLTDAKPGILGTIVYVLKQMNKEIPEENLDWCIGPPIRDCFAILLKTDDPATIERAYSIYRKQYVAIGKFNNRIYEGVPHMLSVLSSYGIRLFVATSKPTSVAESILRHFELGGFFNIVQGAEFDGSRSEKGELLGYIIETCDLSKPDTIMIGDRRYDVFGAHENGITAGAVTYGYGSLTELSEAGADHIFADPQAITDFFTRG